MRILPQFLIIGFILSCLGASGVTPPSSDDLLTKAKSRASEEHKNIFIVFDASW